MPNSNIFCNSPWYELHIYWDGSLGICCEESHKLYTESDSRYNIANMTISEWFDSPPVRQFRQSLLGDKNVSSCSSCMYVERHGGSSRRVKSIQKSVIFAKSAFEESFSQSPGHRLFDYSQKHQGAAGTALPVDLHIDLGNYCNLACKMCSARASSTIASQEVKWGIENSRKYLGVDWTQNQEVWDNFKQQLIDIPKLNNIHFMGGETLLTSRFEDLVDWFIANNRTDICFSFVTNGTVFRPRLIEKLQKFRRVGIEVSIETLDDRNAYQRQGTDTELVLRNIARYREYCNESSITLALRPAISLLTIGSFHQLLKFALDNSLVVKSIPVTKPDFLNPALIPDLIKQEYIKQFQNLNLPDVPLDLDYNASNPNNIKFIISQQAQLCVNILQNAAPTNADFLFKKLVAHCKQWDQIYGYDARKLYPEFNEIWNRYEY